MDKTVITQEIRELPREIRERKGGPKTEIEGERKRFNKGKKMADRRDMDGWGRCLSYMEETREKLLRGA